MTDKEKKNKIADILLDFYDEYDSNEINRPMIPSIYAGKILDSMQEEPVSIWHDASEKPERDDLLIETNDGRIIHRQSINNYGMVKRWAYTSALLNLDNSCNLGNNSQEEPVSGLDNGDMPVERWKQAVKAASNQRNYRSSKGLTETRDDYFVDGVQWADENPKEEPVSKDLEEASQKQKDLIYPLPLEDDFDDPCFSLSSDNKSKRIGFDKGFKVGSQWQKKQMMAKAVEVTVHVDAGNYPYIPQIELYDYDKDVPLAKEDDKYKVILIKED